MRLERTLRNGPLPVTRIEWFTCLRADRELIRLVLRYVAIVWNAFIKILASEAGKDVYRALRGWIRTCLVKLGERKEPILEVLAHQEECAVSFLFSRQRGEAAPRRARGAQCGRGAGGLIGREHEIPRCRAAHAGLRMRAGHRAMVSVLCGALRWGRLVGEPSLLVAFEELTHGLSLGLTLIEHESRPRYQGIRGVQFRCDLPNG